MKDWIHENAAWDDFVALDEELAKIDVPDDRRAPQARIDKVFNARQEAKEKVLADPEILATLRSIAREDVSEDEGHILTELLWWPIEELWSEGDEERFLRDTRVGLHPDEVDISSAFYLATHTPLAPADDLEIGPYSGEPLLDPLDQDHRMLHRSGGTPTRIPGVDIPDSVFLLQVDLRSLWADQNWNAQSAALFETSGLPRDGILQLFATTQGDSVTQPKLSGGGAEVIYLPEKKLLERSVDIDLDTDYPVRVITPSCFPTFMATPLASPTGIERIEALQAHADTEAARRAGVDVSMDPLAPNSPEWSRLLGLPHLTWGLEDGDRDVLDDQLPLESDDDRHVLLFNVASEADFNGVFGDEGRLEIWMRASDLAARRFDDVVSFWRMT